MASKLMQTLGAFFDALVSGGAKLVSDGGEPKSRSFGATTAGQLKTRASMSAKKRESLEAKGMITVGYILIDPETGKEVTIRLGNVRWTGGGLE